MQSQESVDTEGPLLPRLLPQNIPINVTSSTQGGGKQCALTASQLPGGPGNNLPQRNGYPAGLMFWFIRNRFVGSYFVFNATRRSYFAGG